MSSNSSHLKAIRESPEYSAAFDLELWKRDQMIKIKQQLEDEKKKLRQELEEEYIVKDSGRVEELNELRSELEAMAVGLKKSGAALHARILALEKGENSLETKRINLAREHEEVLLSADARVRQVREEMGLQVELLEAKGREKDTTNRRLEEKSQRLENELENLRSLMGTMKSGEDQVRVELNSVTDRLRTTSESFEKAQKQCQQLTTEKEDIRADCNELREACGHYKKQLKNLAAQHNELLRQVSKERSKMIADERTRLSEEANRLETKQAELSQTLQQQQQNRSPHAQDSPSTKEGITEPANSDISDLRGLITSLVTASEKAELNYQQKITSEEKRRKKKEKAKRLASRERGTVYRPITDEGEAATHAINSHVDVYPRGNQSHQPGPPYYSSSVLEQPTTSAPPTVSASSQPSRPSSTTATAQYSRSVVSNREGEGAIRLGDLGHHPELEEVVIGDVDDEHDEQQVKGGEEAVSVSSLSEGAQEQREGVSFESEDESYGNQIRPQDEGAVAASLPVPTSRFSINQQQASAIAQATITAPGGGGGESTDINEGDGSTTTGGRTTGVRTTSSLTTSTTTQQQQLSQQHTQGFPDAQTSTAADFIARLKANRSKLLESGVYSEQDAFIQEMSRKIALYEGFLSESERELGRADTVRGRDQQEVL